MGASRLSVCVFVCLCACDVSKFPHNVNNAIAGKQKDKVTVYDMCPGPVASGIARGTPVIGPAIVWAMDKVFPSKFEAALPVLRLGFDPAFESIAEGGGGEAHHHMVRSATAGV